MINSHNAVSTNINVSRNTLNKSVRYPNLAPLNKDTVSFSGRIVKNLLDLPEEKILAECKKALKDGIKLGEGQEAVAYKMENYPSYCIRREKRTGGNIENFSYNTSLNKYDKVNHVIAKLDEGTHLMQYINGIPLKIMHGKDTPDGIMVKNATKGLVANNFPEKSFKKIINQIEDAKNKGITFDRKGENLHVDALSQEITAFDFSPNFNDIEYNPIAYIYSALDVDNTEHAAKVFGKLCKAYAQRLAEVPTSRLNLDSLDTNFYHRGFIDDAFNEFPNRKILEETQKRLENLIREKQNPTNNKNYIKYLVEEFNEFIDEKVIPVKKNKLFTSWSPEDDL